MNQLQKSKLTEVAHAIYADVDISEYEIRALLEKSASDVYEQLLIKAFVILKEAGFTYHQRSHLFFQIRENPSNADCVNENIDRISEKLDESQDDDITH